MWMRINGLNTTRVYKAFLCKRVLEAKPYHAELLKGTVKTYEQAAKVCGEMRHKCTDSDIAYAAELVTSILSSNPPSALCSKARILPDGSVQVTLWTFRSPLKPCVLDVVVDDINNTLGVEWLVYPTGYDLVAHMY